jgi:hypothetical protein
MATASQFHVFGGQIHYFRKILVQGLKGGKHSQQGWVRHRFHDQSIPLLADNGLISRQLEITWNPQGLISAVLEQSDMAFSVHFAVS